MNGKRIRFGDFSFPLERGLEYLVNDALSETDFLHVNEPGDSFSITLEKDAPIFTVPEKTERDYCLFELHRRDRVIRFFCPEKREHLHTAVWYFYAVLTDAMGEAHTLTGQVRVSFDGDRLRCPRGKPKFIDLLERVELAETLATDFAKGE